MQATRSRGRLGGRNPVDQDILDRAFMMYEANMTVEDITRTLNISRAIFYKYKKQAEQRK